MSVFTDNAQAFATTAEQRVRQLRRAGVAEAIEFLSWPDMPASLRQSLALTAMTDALAAQARAAGIRHLAVVR